MRIFSPVFKRLALLTSVAGSILINGCASPASDENQPAGRAAVTSASLLESQLLDIIQRQQELAVDAADPDAYTPDIQRRFQDIAQDYNALIARNPGHLESRLLYGKFLAEYGDADGARDQFLHAARIDPNVAVIHQQLGTYYAELNDFTRALAYYLNAVQIEPDNAVYHFGLGQLLTAFRDELIRDEALPVERLDADLLNAFKSAAELQPDNLDFQMRYGEAFHDVASPDWQAALDHWNSLSVDSLAPATADAVRLHSAFALIQLQRFDEARELASQVTSPALLRDAEALIDSIP